MRVRLIIPEPETGARNPGGIEPGYYNLVELVELLRKHARDSETIYFIADMLEP